ncbi:cobalamin synthesis protein/P47K family protein [Pavlovales sp. CCMP2436]|nr:cobalamin synthesis protein/P47K family protein [Pavlovales sp. CCMP2436]|mmetsp:Transcript_11458/g.29024  ORF Transcript_11458/g.29024 Transcript_11458/m.29024 type:complete len:336 (-) Transcript_11458:283-1290(-)
MVDTTADTRVPVTVLTGFLGSGKTTLLNRILSEYHGKKIAVIENEFGEVGVDDLLITRRFDTKEEIFEMNNGCICCTVRGDLIRILSKLLKRKEKLDAILIETTGLADPAPVAQTFFMDESMKEFARLDGIITVVDVKHVIQHLDEEKPEGAENEAVEQVVFADRLLLNKTDLVSAEELAEVEHRLRQINKFAPMVHCQNANVPIDTVLGVHAFDLDRILGIDPSFLEESTHEHDQSVTSIGFTQEGDLNMDKLNAWISKLLQERGKEIYRMKGVLSISGSDEKYAFHAVHMLFSGETIEPWGDAKRVNKLVVIGRNLPREEITLSFQACFVDAK